MTVVTDLAMTAHTARTQNRNLIPDRDRNRPLGSRLHNYGNQDPNRRNLLGTLHRRGRGRDPGIRTGRHRPARTRHQDRHNNHNHNRQHLLAHKLFSSYLDLCTLCQDQDSP